MQLLLDEMLPASIAVQLRKRGIDAQAVEERSELVGMSDSDLLTYAASESRTVVTLNIGDFVQLGRAWSSRGAEHAGILLVSSSTFPATAARVGALTNALARLTRSAAVPTGSFITFL